MNIRVLIITCVVASLFLSYGCGGSDPVYKPDPNTSHKPENDAVDKEAIDKIIESFSSPIEMAALIEDMKVPYSQKYLVPSDNVDDFDTAFKKALGLGLLSSDLGYLNVYHKQSGIVEYLTLIKRISDDLDIDQFFDFQTMKRLATNSDNLDSLMFLSVNSYHQMDQYLRDTERSDLSALMVTGVWLEGLFLAVKVNEYANNSDLRDRIGEQKSILNDLIKVMKAFSDKPYFTNLTVKFEELRDAYEGVEIKTETGESKTIVDENGGTLIIPGDYTVVMMTDEQLNEIAKIVEKTRNSIISL